MPSDKIGHVLGYFGLMAWFGQLYPRPRHPRLALIFSALGMILEILQGLSGYRSFDYFDMLANLCGVLLGWLFAYSAFGKTLAAIEQRLYPAD
jgi:glycopeptide antibiotics resistance protein